MRWQEALGFGLIAATVGVALALTTRRDTDMHRGFVALLKTAPRFRDLPPDRRDAAVARVARLTWMGSSVLSAAITTGLVVLVWAATR